MVRKMRVIILSRPFLFLGHRKGGASKEAPPFTENTEMQMCQEI